MNKLKDTFEELKITNDEIKKLSDAFKDEEFRKLFRDYAEELQNPENKKLYEAELIAMENDRGMDVEFINPTPGHVLKAIQNGEKKIFVNICISEKIKPAKVVPSTKKGVIGSQWSIPHSFSPPREDIDKRKDSCLVYDVVFNPETYKKSESDSRFRKMLHETALQGIETSFKVKIDQTNVRVLKMKMKGCPNATVIRKKKEDFEKIEKDLQEKDFGPLKFPYPQEPNENKIMVYDVKDTTEDLSLEYNQPKHKIKYSDEFDIANYVGEQVQHNLRPKKMIIEIKLPLVTSSKSVDLDIDDVSLKLLTDKPVKYKLDLKFTYPVISEKGTAKFDKSTRILKLDLPIVQLPEQTTVVKSDFPSSDNGDDFTKSSLIDDSYPVIENKDEGELEGIQESIINERVTNDSSIVVNEAERRVPNIELKSRMNSSFIFILCEIKNVDTNDMQILCEKPLNQIQNVMVTFSSCGQGGWKSYYKVPLTVVFVGSQALNECDISYRASKENITLKVSIQSTKISTVAYLDQTMSFEMEDGYSRWKYLNISEKISDDESEQDLDTFNIAFGNVGNDTFKIICVPLDQTIDIEKEFSKEIVQIITEEQIDDKNLEIEQDDTMVNVCGDISRENIEKDNESNVDENVSISEEEVIDKINESMDSSKSKEIEGLVPSEYFEERRDPIHRTYCAVTLDENLLFDLE